MESFQKRDRDRKKREKRNAKVARKKDRAEQSRLGIENPGAPPLDGENPALDGGIADPPSEPSTAEVSS